MHGSFIHITMTQHIYNDGGRRAEHDARCKAQGFDTFADFKDSHVRDCVTRSLAIITGKPYGEIWKRCADINLADGKKYSANHGVRTNRKAFRDYAKELGLEWVQPVQGRFKDMKFPPRCVVSMNGHYTAIIDGVMHDTFNPTPAGLAHVYGWWVPKSDIKTAVLFNVCAADTGAKLNRAPLNAECAANMQRLMFLNYKRLTNINPI